MSWFVVSIKSLKLIAGFLTLLSDECEDNFCHVGQNVHLLWDFCDFTLTAGPRKMRSPITRQGLGNKHSFQYTLTSQDFFFFKQKVYML